MKDEEIISEAKMIDEQTEEDKPMSKAQATLQKIYAKHPHLAPKKVDGLEIKGIAKVKKAQLTWYLTFLINEKWIIGVN